VNNYIHSGEVIVCTAPSGGVTAGTPVLIGQLFGVPIQSADENDDFSLQVKGVCTLARDTNDAAWTVGQPVYWDVGAAKATVDSDGNPRIGSVGAAALTAAATGAVILGGAAGLPSATDENTVIYDHEDDVGGNTLLAAAPIPRKVMIVARVTEAHAGSGSEPAFQIGYTGSLDTFLDVDGTGIDAIGEVQVVTGILPADEALLVTVTDGTGGSEAGKVEVSALAVA
jgi:predicted RecA/RadA family phage recombinase